jgi:hypothetical protein
VSTRVPSRSKTTVRAAMLFGYPLGCKRSYKAGIEARTFMDMKRRNVKPRPLRSRCRAGHLFQRAAREVPGV